MPHSSHDDMRSDDMRGGARRGMRSDALHGLPLAHFLPLGGLVVALLVCMDGVGVILPECPNQGFFLSFFLALLASLLATSLFFTISGALAQSGATAASGAFATSSALANTATPPPTTRKRFPSSGWLSFGGLLAAGAFVLVWCIQAISVSEILALVCGVLCGFGIIAVSLFWCLSLSRLNERQTLFLLAIVCLIAGAIKTAVIGAPILFELLFHLPLPAHVQLVVVPLGLGVSSLGCVHALAERDAPKPADNRGEREVDAGGEESPAKRAGGMLGRNWVIFCGCLLCITVAAGIWSHAVLVSVPADGSAPNTTDSVIGFLLGGVVLLVAGRLLSDEAFRFSFLILPLICVASLILVWFLRSWSNDSGEVFSFLPLGFSAVICGCLHITRLGTEARNGLSGFFVFGLSIAALIAIFFAWFGIWSLLGQDGASSVDLGLKVIYLVAVATQMVVLAQRQPRIAIQTQDRIFAELCAEFSRQFSLSKREAEILSYLVQGYSSAYIAERQFVSINTIKTHIKRIYAKAEVHSKQELLDLMHRG